MSKSRIKSSSLRKIAKEFNSKLIKKKLFKSLYSRSAPNFVMIKRSDLMSELGDLTDIVGLQIRFVEDSSISGSFTFRFNHVTRQDASVTIDIDSSFVKLYNDVDTPITGSNNVQDVFNPTEYDDFVVGVGHNDDQFFYISLDDLGSLSGELLFFSKGHIQYGPSITGTNSFDDFHTIKIQGYTDGIGKERAEGSPPYSLFLLGLPCPPEWKKPINTNVFISITP